MGLVLLGADNLASDQADQNPSVFSRPKQAGHVPGKGWIEVIDLDASNVKIILNNYVEWPSAELYAVKSKIKNSGKYWQEVDLSPSYMKTIPSQAFSEQNPSHGFKKIVFPKSLETIGTYAFKNNLDLEISGLPDNVKQIRYEAFASCNVTMTKLPKSITTVHGRAFADSNAKIDVLPASLVEVQTNAFVGMANVNLEVECNMTSSNTLPKTAFKYESENLAKVWLRSSCVEFPGDNGAFQGPENVVIYAEPDSKPDGWSEHFNRVYIGDSLIDYYDAEVVWGQKTSPF